MKKTSLGKKIDLYIPSEDDLWNIPSDHKKPIKRKRRHIYFRDTLRYCESCKTQWERNTCGSQIHYDHLPTYGLPRVMCGNCKDNI